MNRIGLLSFALLTLASLNIQAEQAPAPQTAVESTQQEPENNLMDLNWLVGEWIDDEEDLDVTNSFKWDKNKKFLIEQFKMEIPEEEESQGEQQASQKKEEVLESYEDELEGQQVIGWDPVSKKIRSWVFDTDGGFGMSNWGKNGKTWYSSTVYTLPDGRKATATHIYTQIDDNSYTFSSENRDVDGELLPDVGPYKFVRKK